MQCRGCLLPNLWGSKIAQSSTAGPFGATENRGSAVGGTCPGISSTLKVFGGGVGGDRPCPRWAMELYIPSIHGLINEFLAHLVGGVPHLRITNPIARSPYVASSARSCFACKSKSKLGGGFKYFVFFISTWGNDLI